MPPLPVVSGDEAVRVLESFGYQRKRQSGSHITMVHPRPGFRNISVPRHKELMAGTLRGIIRDAGLSVADFEERWRSLYPHSRVVPILVCCASAKKNTATHAELDSFTMALSSRSGLG